MGGVAASAVAIYQRTSLPHVPKLLLMATAAIIVGGLLRYDSRAV